MVNSILAYLTFFQKHTLPDKRNNKLKYLRHIKHICIPIDIYRYDMYDIYISRPFKNMYLNCMGSLIWDFSSVNHLEKLLEICNSLKKLADKYKHLEI